MPRVVTRTEVDAEESEVVLDGRTGGPTQEELVGSQLSDEEVLRKIDAAYVEESEAAEAASAATSRKNAAHKDVRKWLAILHSRRADPALWLFQDGASTLITRLDAAAGVEGAE